MSVSRYKLYISVCINSLINTDTYIRDPIKVGVNVTSSRKKKSLRNVRVSMQSEQVLPGSSYNAYRFELRGRNCVSIIIPPKSRLAEIIDFATQVWAIARVSTLSPKIHFIFICFIRTRFRIDFSHAHCWNISVNLIRLGAVAPKISGLTPFWDFSSRKGHFLLRPTVTSKYLVS